MYWESKWPGSWSIGCRAGLGESGESCCEGLNGGEPPPLWTAWNSQHIAFFNDTHNATEDRLKARILNDPLRLSMRSLREGRRIQYQQYSPEYEEGMIGTTQHCACPCAPFLDGRRERIQYQQFSPEYKKPTNIKRFNGEDVRFRCAPPLP